MQLILKSIKPQIGNVKTYTFTSKQPIDWQAGQYLHYVLPHEQADDRGAERWFTIASPPFNHEISITTRIFDQNRSSFKSKLDSLKLGDEIMADGPEGDFVVKDHSKPAVFVAGGIGITPFYAILTQAAHHSVPINAILLYANKNAEEIVYKKELEDIAKKNKDFSIEYFINDNMINADTLRTQFQKQLDAVFYFSGPEPMVKALAKTAEEVGIPASQIKLDDFPGYDSI